jgi:large subunit ribosomal protein L17
MKSPNSVLRNLATQLLTHGKVETTLARAKEVRVLADRLITLGKKASLGAKQQSRAILGSEYLTKKLFSEVAERYRSMNGGYCRILKSRVRKGDTALLASVQYRRR